jgi:single-strand DNA-binding protein
MAASNVNVVVITGNLTRDPELKQAGSTSVCELGVAVNSRIKKGGEWVDHVDYFDAVVFGSQAENVAQYKSKGDPVAIHGKLRHERWETKDTHEKRSKVKIIANSIQFLPSKKSGDGGGEPDPSEYGAQAEEGSQGQSQEEDIPF